MNFYPQKSAGYTTTLKLMQIMHDKGLLNRNDEERSHVYSAAVKKESIQKQVVSRMISSISQSSEKFNNQINNNQS